MAIEATSPEQGLDVQAIKEAQRHTWAAGDYDGIVRHIWPVGGRLVERVAIAAGERVLDVACGTGNASIPAAQAGARVVGLDLTPELLDGGRRAAAEAGVEIEWVVGDAEALPYEDGSFDVVLSTFGCMFAPRHGVAAREIARVVRPGGRIGICSWTPEGTIGHFFQTLGSYLPPPPPGTTPPVLWGSEDHVRGLFAGSGIDLRFDREIVELRFGSIDEAVSEYAAKFGPLVKARQLLEPQGRWTDLLDDMAGMFEQHNRATDGTVAYPAEYLVVTGTKAG